MPYEKQYNQQKLDTDFFPTIAYDNKSIDTF